MGDCYSACPRCRTSCKRALESNDTQAKAVEQWTSMDSRRSGLAHRYRDRFRAPLNTRMTAAAIDMIGFAACANGPAPNNFTKHYGLTTPCGSSASGVMGAVESNFARFGNYSRWGGAESVSFAPPAGMGVGSTIPITVGIMASIKACL